MRDIAMYCVFSQEDNDEIRHDLPVGYVGIIAPVGTSWKPVVSVGPTLPLRK